MIRQQRNYGFSSIKSQNGDVKANILVLLAFALLAFLVWQYNQNTTADEDQVTDPLTMDDSQASEDKQEGIIDPLQQKTLEELENINFQNTEEMLDQQIAEQNQLGSPEDRLIELDESDDLVREEVAGLSSEKTWLTWLATSQAIRKFVQFMENISRGNVPHKYFNFLAPAGHFKVTELENNQYILDPAGYKRYNQLAKTIDSFDAENLVNTYSMVKPYIDTAWDEMKSPRQSFDEVLLTAINQIQAAPAISDDVRLIRPTVMYKFADANLEQLNAVSKQLIRMGPRNTRMIQKKVDEIQRLLIAQEATPEPEYTEQDSTIP